MKTEKNIYQLIKKLYEKNVDNFITREMFDQSKEPNKELIDDIKNNKLLIYTAFTGDYDTLNEPEFIDENCDYVCYTTNPNLESKVWDVRLMEDCRLDNNRMAKRYRVFPHKYFPEYKYSFWMDGSFKITGSIREYIYKFANTKMLNCIHPERDCIYDEVAESKLMQRYPKFVMDEQIKAYQLDGMPRHYGMMASGFIFRQHNDSEIISLMEQWWNEIIKYSSQDQLSLAYLLWRNDFHPSVSNVFCWMNEYWKIAKKDYHHKHIIQTPTSSYNLILSLENNVKKENTLSDEELYLLVNDVKTLDDSYKENIKFLERMSRADFINAALARLYFDAGKGFIEDNVLIESVPLMDDISLNFDISGINAKNLRFDPIEGRLSIIKISKLGFNDSNGNFIEAEFSHNGQIWENDPSIYFLTSDPQMCIDIPENNELREFIFEGSISIIANSAQAASLDKLITEKENDIKNLKEEISNNKDTIEKLQNETKQLSNSLDHAKQILKYVNEHPFKHMLKKILKYKDYNNKF